MDGLSDRGSIPLSSTNDGLKEDSRNAGKRVPAVFICIFQIVVRVLV